MVEIPGGILELLLAKVLLLLSLEYLVLLIQLLNLLNVGLLVDALRLVQLGPPVQTQEPVKGTRLFSPPSLLRGRPLILRLLRLRVRACPRLRGMRRRRYLWRGFSVVHQGDLLEIDSVEVARGCTLPVQACLGDLTAQIVLAFPVLVVRLPCFRLCVTRLIARAVGWSVGAGVLGLLAALASRHRPIVRRLLSGPEVLLDLLRVHLGLSLHGLDEVVRGHVDRSLLLVAQAGDVFLE